MKLSRVWIVVASAALAALVGACDRAPEVASPTCSNLDQIKDAAEREALAKKCPRSGPAFKPSEKKEW